MVAANVTVTKFEIQNTRNQTTDSMFYSDTFNLVMDWDASSNGINIHEGDFFDITLPDNMRFPSGTTARDFEIKDSEGNVVAHAHVTPGPGDAGGTVRVTFTNAIENRYNVKGSIRLAAKFAIRQSETNKKHTFKVTANGKTIEKDIEVTGPKDLHDEHIAKWGQGNFDPEGNPAEREARWIMRINHGKATLSNVVVEDKLTGGTGTERYISNSFSLRRVVMDQKGNVTDWGTSMDIDDKLEIAPDGRSFKLKLGNINGEQYRLEYVST